VGDDRMDAVPTGPGSVPAASPATVIPSSARRYHIWTIGCQMNTADSQHLATDLERLGYAWTDDAEAADVIVLNTCVVRQQVEDKVGGRLGSLRRVKDARPETVIALMGCLVGHKPSRALAERFPMVDVFIPPSATRPLLDHLRARALETLARDADAAQVTARWALQDDAPGDLVLPERERGRTVAANVPIVYGCNWVCTFCIIPSRRGPERSRPPDEIVAHVCALVAQGVREVTLLGQIVDRYGHDLGEADALCRLLERLDAISGLARIRFLTSHPLFMTPRLLETVARLPKVMEQIEVPVQAGDDGVLRNMKRGYTADDFRRLVADIRTRVPGAAIHTDVIVGFPGETVEQFERTHDLLADLRLDKVHIAKFSARPGTVAAKLLADDVDPVEKERRRKRLDDLQRELCAAINARQLGQAVEVLVDGCDGDRWRGRTRTNKIVFFDDPHPRLGQVIDVVIEWTGPWSMVGRAADAPTGRPAEAIALTPT
jgi:tRNA-2-methylthio-N6-dimethylallyladenosine synthase